MQNPFDRIRLSVSIGLTITLACIWIVAAQARMVSQTYESSWIQTNQDGFGDDNNKGIYSLESYGGYLYAGTKNFVSGAQLWRSENGYTWTAIITDGFGSDTNYGIEDLAEFDGALYASTPNDDLSISGEVWRSTNGLDWTQVVSQAFGDLENIEIWNLEVYDNRLYAGTANNDGGGEVWSTPNGTEWAQANADGFGNSNNLAISAFAVFSDFLYAGTTNYRTGAEIWRTNGLTWTVVITEGFGNAANRYIGSLEVFDGQLYALTTNGVTGIQVWRSSNGEEWMKVADNGFDNPNNASGCGLVVYGESIFAITGNEEEGAEVWASTDGVAWEQIVNAGWGDQDNEGSFWDNSIAIFDDRLFVGTNKWASEGAELWEYWPNPIAIDPLALDQIQDWGIRISRPFTITNNSPVELVYTATHQGAAWLEIDPPDSTVESRSHNVLQVSFDSHALQPGAYSETIVIASNDPVQLVITVPVTLSVETTTGMGVIEGTLYDVWALAPISGTVEIAAMEPVPADPEYRLWAPAGTSMLSATEEGYLAQDIEVTIVSGITQTLDIYLIPNEPRLELAPASLQETLWRGQSITRTLALSNSGPAELNYTLKEADFPVTADAMNPDALQGARILYDLSHGQEDDLSEYSIISTDLVAAGARIDFNETLDVNDATLSGYDIFWVSNSGPIIWSTEELQSVSNWVDGGGSLLIHGSGCGDGRNISEYFGASFSYYCHLFGPYGTINAFPPHEITDRVSSYYYVYVRSGLEFTPQYIELLRTNIDNYGIFGARKYGAGRIVTAGTWSVNDYAIVEADNRRLANNTFTWLAQNRSVDLPWLKLGPSHDTLMGGGSEEIRVQLDTGSLQAGEYLGYIHIIDNDDNPSSPLQVPITLTIAQAPYAVYLLPATQIGSALPGEVVTYSLRVENLGSLDDSFSLDVSSTWNTQLSSISTTPLAPSQGKDFTLRVEVPSGASPGDEDTAVVTAISTGNTAVKASASATTSTDINPTYGLDLSVSPITSSAAPGETITYTVTITNLSNVPGDFSMETTTGAWSASLLSNITPLLQPGGVFTTSLSVTLPEGTTNGEQEVTTVTVTSIQDINASRTVQVTTQAVSEDKKIYIPVVLKSIPQQ